MLLSQGSAHLKSSLPLFAAALVTGSIVAIVGGSWGVWAVVALAAAAVIAAFSLTAQTTNPVSAASPVDATGDLPSLASALFSQLPDPVMLIDGAGRVVFANPAMQTVVGERAERKPMAALLRTPTLLEAVAAASESGEPQSIEFVVHVPVERHYQAFAARVTTKPTLSLLLLHDLTAVKRGEQMRADFVANASHELRTPLAAVSGFIDTLKGHAKDDPEARERFLDIMSVEAGRMRRLIDDLLSLNRIEMNEHVPPSSILALEPILRQAAMALQPLAEADAVRISIEAEKDLPDILGERDELIQLFQNLIHNAIKYGREHGKVMIAISAHPADGTVLVAIKDEGDGIPEAAIPRLTERFYRVDVKRSRERGGTGLGLAIVKHIVNRHHGRLKIESRQGLGSTFTVILPAIRHASAA